VATRYDLDALLSTVRPLLRQHARASLNLPVYDRARRAKYPQSVPMSIEPDDVIVVEGVPALLVDPLAQAAGVRVHVEMPETARVARLRADYRWRGESDAAVDGLLASRAKDETAPVQEARARADFIIDAWTDR
jgi:uridine kinase